MGQGEEEEGEWTPRTVGAGSRTQTPPPSPVRTLTAASAPTEEHYSVSLLRLCFVRKSSVTIINFSVCPLNHGLGVYNSMRIYVVYIIQYSADKKAPPIKIIIFKK